jgi:hypothetical protein
MRKKYIAIVIGVIFMITSVFVAIEASASGAQMRLLEDEETTLSRQKSELEGSLVKGMSSTEAEGKSLELGFVKPTDLIYLNSDGNKNQALINTISR